MQRWKPHWGRRFASFATAWLSVLGTAAFGATLTLTVDNIEENKGLVHVVIYDAANWLDRNPANFAGAQSVDITERKGDGPLVANFELEPGEYAAFAYHDRNANLELDKNLIGLPEEPYAFSGPFNKLRRPEFADCKFAVGEDGAAITVGLQN